MRVYEVILRSGAKVEIIAELLHDDSGKGDNIYFYSDKSMNQILAYFNRAEVAGVIFGPEKVSASSRRH